ncbi:MAG: DUF5654 family protein [Patescibacteria group bacterium]
MGDDEKPKPKITSAVRERTVTLVLAGFGLVAALAWNDAIQALFKEIFGEAPSSVVAKFGYALIITAIVTIVSLRLGKVAEKK